MLREKNERRKLREKQRAEEVLESTIQGLLKTKKYNKLTDEEDRQVCLMKI